MKRQISTFLVLILCFCAWAEPVKAEEFSNDSWFDVLDYASLNNSGSNVASIKTNDYVAFTLPSSQIVHDIDILVYSDSVIRYSRLRRYIGDTTSFALTVEDLGDNLYRLTGDAVGYSFAGLYLTFTFATGSGNIQIQRFNLLTVSGEHFTSIATATGTYGNGEEIHFVKDPTDPDPAYQYIDFRDYNSDSPYVCQIYFDDWKKYDYIDIILSTRVKTVESVYAHFGDILIPFDLCFLESSDQISSRFIAARLDLRGLDHASDWIPYLEFSGNLSGGALNVLSIASVSGYLIGSDINPLFYYFSQLFDKMQVYFGSLAQVIDEGFENLNLNQSILFSTYTDYLRTYIENQTSLLNEHNSLNFTNLSTWITAQTNSLTTLINSNYTKWYTRTTELFLYVDGWISAQTDTLTTLINNTYTNWNTRITELFSLHFTNLSSWISAQTNTLTTLINSTYSKWYTRITDLFLYLDSWIEIQTEELVEVIKGDAHAGDQFQQEVAEKDQELEDMAAVMDSVTKPNIGNIDVSVDTYVRPVDVNTLTAPLMVFLTGDIFGPIAIMSILMATVGYVLYGKR